jgi:hypothetical protein
VCGRGRAFRPFFLAAAAFAREEAGFGLVAGFAAGIEVELEGERATT